MPRTSTKVEYTCKFCGKTNLVPAYYVKIHGRKSFCDSRCFNRYRQIYGLIQAVQKNPESKIRLTTMVIENERM